MRQINLPYYGTAIILNNLVKSGVNTDNSDKESAAYTIDLFIFIKISRFVERAITSISQVKLCLNF